jgi:ABC-type nitrate/sulfonate/bicarbonate transport system substrate-binding protein
VAGAFEIAQAGVDNAVALADANKDVVIVSGGSNGMNEFIVRPEIKSYADIKGTKVVVDAPNTAYALIAYKVLQMQGISRDQYGLTPAGGCPQRLAAMREDKANASAMLNLPCNLIAMKDGYKSMGTAVDLIGPYQADGTWVMRSWAQAHPDLLVKFLQGCIEGYRWAATPSNKAAAAALIVKVLKVEPDIAMGSVDITVGPKQGLAKDLAFDRNGFINTLKLRAEMIGGDANPNPDKYVDLSYLQKALAGL